MTSLNADVALRKLMAGNRRYAANKSTHPHQTSRRRRELMQCHDPFAIILGCADSRVPPEIIFDQGLGDLFVVRVAGNVIDDTVLGSIEYAAEHLKTPLLVVLGHKACGAVKATMEALTVGKEGVGHIRSLVDVIQAAIVEARIQRGDFLDNAIRANVQRMVQQLRLAEPILSSQVRDKKLKIVGAYYDLESGQVEIIGG
jgi:carbonic anhydrase